MAPRLSARKVVVYELLSLDGVAEDPDGFFTDWDDAMETNLAAVIAAVVVLPGLAARGRQKAYVLTALADIGTVYWRYDYVHYRRNEWSLGFRVFRDSATTEVTYRDGRLTRRRTAQPPRLSVQLYPR